jgi:lysyl-tRNA synthetase class II
MRNIKVYKMNDYEWWASDLSAEETNELYKQEIGEENDLEDIEECDIDKEGLRWNLESGTKEHEEAVRKLNGLVCTGNAGNNAFGDIVNNGGNISIYISLREAIEKSGEYKEPFCIASTEW